MSESPVAYTLWHGCYSAETNLGNFENIRIADESVEAFSFKWSILDANDTLLICETSGMDLEQRDFTMVIKNDYGIVSGVIFETRDTALKKMLFVSMRKISCYDSEDSSNATVFVRERETSDSIEGIKIEKNREHEERYEDCQETDAMSLAILQRTVDAQSSICRDTIEQKDGIIKRRAENFCGTLNKKIRKKKKKAKKDIIIRVK